MAITQLVLKTKLEQQERLRQSDDTVRLGKSGTSSSGKKKCCR